MATVTKRTKRTKRAGDEVPDTELESAATRSKQNAGGDCPSATDCHTAASANQTADDSEDDADAAVIRSLKRNARRGGESDCDSEQWTSPASACVRIRAEARRRREALGFRIKIDNSAQAMVRCRLGYMSGQDETSRKKLVAEAARLVKAIGKGEELIGRDAEIAADVSGLLTGAATASDVFQTLISLHEKSMTQAAKLLPVAPWVESIRGFGLLGLALIVGECGDLSNYANPAKVWKRMGLAPYNGHMPSTWRGGKVGKLTAAEWEAIGYCPRRRSIMFNLADSMIKANGPAREERGPYRTRYDQAKVSGLAKHPDWTPMHCHLHGLLLLAKMLLRDLWCQWNGKAVCGEASRDTERPTAAH